MTVSWSFGDGSSTTGPAATHTYTRPGSFPVTVTATDALGNATSQSGSVTVAAGTSDAPSGTSGETLTVTDLKLSPTRFRRGKHAATIAAAKAKKKVKALPTATTISFALSPGRHGHAQLRTGAHRRAHRPQVRGYLKVPSQGQALHPLRRARVPRLDPRRSREHRTRIVFDGVLDGDGILSPGTYRLSLTATAGLDVAHAAQHPTFTLLRLTRSSFRAA